MAWVKIPAEHHPIFLAALPSDPRVSTLQMFGGIAAKVNGHMMAGLFGRSAMVRLSKADQDAALALDGAAPFDPMGNNRVMTDSILLPEEVMDDRSQLRDWLARALAYTATLPPKSQGAKPKRLGGAQPKPAPATRSAAKPQVQATKPPMAKPRAKPKATKPPMAKPRAKPKATNPPVAKPRAKPTAAKPPAARPRAKPKATSAKPGQRAKPNAKAVARR
jgi:TfoX/Sxy family transcriptional regulator of competence genes